MNLAHLANRTARKLSLGLAVAAFIMTNLSCTGSTEPSTEPKLVEGGLQGTIAYVYLSEIFVASPDRADIKRLSPHGSIDVDPAWSPNGTRIAYSGTRIAYSSVPGQGDYLDIYVMNADGTNRVRLTQGVRGSNYRPAWSPDGSRIAFVSDRGTYPQIYVMNANGMGLAQLTNSNGSSTSPEWSPDGKRILFDRDMNGLENKGLFTMGPDGSNVRQLSSGYRDTRPTWSPDGTRIAYVREFEFVGGPDDGRNLFVMNADGSNVMQLTRGIPSVSDPTWSPEGTSIAFGVVSKSKICEEEDNGGPYPCGLDVLRVGLDGVVDPTLFLSSASNPAWLR